MQADIGAGFFHGFADGGVAGGFIVFHEAGRQRPVAEARFDRALAQQDAHIATFIPDRDGAQYHLWILVMNSAAIAAYITRAIVTLGNR